MWFFTVPSTMKIRIMRKKKKKETHYSLRVGWVGWRVGGNDGNSYLLSAGGIIMSYQSCAEWLNMFAKLMNTMEECIFRILSF